MDALEHVALVERILSPHAKDADRLLLDLGLAGIPSKDKVHEQIEENLLLPRSRLPDHWLPTYQL